MISIEPFVYFKKISIINLEEMIEYFKQLESNTTNHTEVFYDFESSMESMKVSYFRKVNSLDLSVDSSTQEIIPEHSPNILRSEIIINFSNETLIVWGRPNIVKFLNVHLNNNPYYKIFDKTIDFYSYFDNFNIFDPEITEVSFNDINVIGKYISTASLTISNTTDALFLINNLGAKVSKVRVKLYSKQNDFVELNTDLEKGIIKLNLPIANKVFIEDIKSEINNLKLG
ncbi:hypothetical protein [Halobacillus rhizosphaerae]|uniref:hypothetical protein n=1 Tax=Halobacillus rhizosphaerae TaxID=3064889 RepID=UPI00398B47F6